MIEFSKLGRCAVESCFDGGSMTSDGEVMLLGATDRKLGLLQAAARCIADTRNPLLTAHAVLRSQITQANPPVGRSLLSVPSLSNAGLRRSGAGKSHGKAAL